MNLLEYMQEHKEEEITVFDKDYDMETYFEYSADDSKNNWDKAIDKIAEHLEVVEEVADENRPYGDNPCVVVNMTEVMERSLESGVMDDLFISKNIGAVMSDMHNILSWIRKKGNGGYVSEEWIMDFVDALDKAESFQQEKESKTADVLEI